MRAAPVAAAGELAPPGEVPAAGEPPRAVTPLAILADLLAQISRRVHSMSQADPELVAELHEAAELAGGLEDYTARLTTPESDALRELAARTARQDWASHPGAGSGTGSGAGLEQEMLSGHVEGQTLKMLVHATGARQVLEIGMFTGYSALAMAEALPHDGRVVACEIDPYVAELAQDCFSTSPAGRRIEVRVGPALDTLRRLAADGEVFDLVFLDADKAGYVDYFTALLDQRLLAPGALLCVDNTLMQGHPWISGQSSPNGSAIAIFNRVVAEDPRVEQVVLPVRDGLTLIRRSQP